MKILPQFIFNSRDPIVMGVVVEAGQVKQGTPMCVPSKNVSKSLFPRMLDLAGSCWNDAPGNVCMHFIVVQNFGRGDEMQSFRSVIAMISHRATLLEGSHPAAKSALPGSIAQLWQAASPLCNVDVVMQSNKQNFHCWSLIRGELKS